MKARARRGRQIVRARRLGTEEYEWFLLGWPVRGGGELEVLHVELAPLDPIRAQERWDQLQLDAEEGSEAGVLTAEWAATGGAAREEAMREWRP